MKKLLFLIVAGAVVIGIANSHTTTPAANTPATQPGLSTVYTRIGAMTDCAALQAEFDQADANGKADRARGNIALAKITTTYMSAADDRMRTIGCY